MSYCVNCGVELSRDLKKCPLCSVPVINPAATVPEQETHAFSEKIVLPPSARRRYAAFIFSMVLLIPNIVFILVNLIFNPGSFWSFYVLTSTALFWVLAVFPFFTKKIHPFLLWGFDSIAVAAYVFFFFSIDGKEVWFLKCALPIIAAVSVFALIFMLWLRAAKRGKTKIAIHLLLDITLCALVVGGELSFYYKTKTPAYISLIVDISLLCIVLFLFYCDRSKRMKAWLSRNFFTE